MSLNEKLRMGTACMAFASACTANAALVTLSDLATVGSMAGASVSVLFLNGVTESVLWQTSATYPEGAAIGTTWNLSMCSCSVYPDDTGLSPWRLVHQAPATFPGTQDIRSVLIDLAGTGTVFDPGNGSFYEQLKLSWLDAGGLQDPSMGFFADTDRVVMNGATGAAAGGPVSAWAGQQPSTYEYRVEATAPAQIPEPGTLLLAGLALLSLGRTVKHRR